MAFTLDSYLGIHAKSLVMRDHRTSQLATNIANLNTPHYKAKDIDFESALSSAMEGGEGLEASNPGHMNPEADFSSHVKYRVPHHLTLDGNTVDKDMETKEFVKNALGYQASLTFLNSKIRTMLTAIKGE